MIPTLSTSSTVSTSSTTGMRRPASWTSPSGTRCAGSPGCRTELEDITEVEYRQLRLERVVLVGVWTDGSRRGRRELDGRARRCSPRPPARRCSTRSTSAGSKPDPATYIGRGKVDGPRARSCSATGADTVICDGELAPSQLRNLEDKLKVKVVDRTALILDIFAQHAKSQGGPGAGRAGPAQLHEAAPARLGRQPVPPGRWPGRPAAAASVAVAPVRPRSRPTGAGSTPRSPSCAASSRT